MSTFDDPNREALGLDPIWTGAGGEEPPPEPEPDPEPEPTGRRPAKPATEPEHVPDKDADDEAS